MHGPLLIGVALAIVAPAPKEPPKKEPPSLVGEWVPESAVHGGKPHPHEPGATITFTTDGKCLLKEGKAGMRDEMTYRIDSKKNPPEIDLAETDAGMKGPQPMPGIYKIEGDTLTICLALNQKRPTEFASPAGSDLMLIILKRAKKD
jgi:uncharacterized protein (TIGR03067 family)